jgi:ectoine hydroxylase-related dioxygenase (phytanoyl-CoA dioxygenase family)
MTPEDILARPPKVLTQEQRARYFEDGYLIVEGAVSDEWLARLRGALADFDERSRAMDGSEEDFTVETGHGPDNPRLRQVLRATDHHPVVWDYASESSLPDLVADLVGPDVKFREATLNNKRSGGGQEVKWHQDYAYFPHTNRSPMMTLTLLEDIGLGQGALQVIPRTHKGEILDHYDAQGRWLGVMSDEAVAGVDLDRAVALTGPAGTVAVTNCCIVHGSARNDSDRDRPIMILGYSSADSICYTRIPWISRYQWEIVRGAPAKSVHQEPLSMRLPPDWGAEEYAALQTAQEATRQTVTAAR